MSGKAAQRRNMKTPLRKQYDPAAACAKKMRYESWAEAERVANIHAQRDHILVMAHACGFCGGWHNAKPLTVCSAPVTDPVRGVAVRLLNPR